MDMRRIKMSLMNSAVLYLQRLRSDFLQLFIESHMRFRIVLEYIFHVRSLKCNLCCKTQLYCSIIGLINCAIGYK